MTKKDQREERDKTQKTDKDYEIPVPTRRDFYRDLEKAVEPVEGNGQSDLGESGQKDE